MTEKSEFTRLIFVRHGQIDSNLEHRFVSLGNEPLNPEGEAQVQKTAQRLAREFKPRVLLSSPVYRARQSAAIIGQTTGLQAEVFSELSEVDFGKFTGLTMAEAEAQFPAEFQELHRFLNAADQSKVHRPEFPGGETFAQITERVARFTQTILQNWPGEEILAVAHGGIIKCALMLYAGGNFERSVPIALDNASISVVDFYKGRPMIRLVNGISQLDMPLSFIKTRAL